MANLNALGCDHEEMDVVEGIDTLIASARSPYPLICSIEDFYKSIFPKKPELTLCKEPPPLQAGISSKNGKFYGIRSAEQFELLARSGLVNRGKK